jgi:hypothetical protein
MPASPALWLAGRPLRACLGLLAVLAGMLALSAPALADGEASYMLGSSFKGEGPCAVSEPGALAVNEASGDVYVLDRATSAVARFGPSGECLGRIEPAKATKLGVSVDGLAVDNSASSPSFGDVYVVAQGGKAVAKYTPEGTLLSTITNEFEQIHGVAVDTKGTLWVYQGKTAEETTIESFTNEVTNVFVSTIELALNCAQRRGFAVGPNAESFYVGRSRENRNEGCEPVRVAVKLNAAGETATEGTRGTSGDPAFYAQLDNRNTTGIGVNPITGEVFFDNETSVSAFSPEGVFVQRFGDEAGAGALQLGAGVAVDASTGNVFVYDAREGGVLDVFVPKTFEEVNAEQISGLADGRAWEQVSPLNKLGSSIYPITYVFGQVQASEAGNAITYTSNAPIVANPPTNRAPEPTQNLSRRGAGSWSTEDIVPPAGPEAAGYATNSGSAYEAFSYELTTAFVNPAEHQKVTKTEPLLSPEATETTPFQRDLTPPSSSCEPVPSTCYTALVSPLNDTAEMPFGAVGGKSPVHFTSATPDGHHAVLLTQVPLTAEGVAQGANEGLYEWATGGALKLVSVFPAAEAAPEELALRLGGPGESAGSIMRNAISSCFAGASSCGTDGTRVIWSTGEGKERLFLRDTAKSETIRIDLKQGVVKPPKAAHAVFQTASADGSKIFFTDVEPLTEDATTQKGEEPEAEAEERGLGDLYVCQVTEEGGKLGCALKDLTAEVEAANEEAAVQGVIGASEHGNDVYFVADAALGTHGGTGNCQPHNATEVKEEREGIIASSRCNLYTEHFNGEAWEPPVFVASLSSLDQNDWHGDISAGGLVRVTSRVSPNGNFLAFMSNQSLTGYNNEDVNPAAEGAHDEEVFLYNAQTNKVLCASCKGSEEPPQGVFDTLGSGEGLGLTVDRPGNWQGMWLAGNIPGWTARSAEAAIYQSRYLSDTGRLVFNSADALVPAAEGDVRKETVNGEEATVGVENVYEYEPNGEGGCESETGCISLISSGNSQQESAFLDASVTGNDIFFLTSQQLIPQDKDTSFDIYDARVCSAGSPCLVSPPEPPPPCAGEACKTTPTSVPAPPGVPPSTLANAGNGPGKVEDRTEGTKPPPPVAKPTRAQKLKKALKACKKVKKKKKRVACERTARKKYGPVKKGKK